MIQVYADGSLIFDSRIPDLALLSLKVTRGLNKGGTATLILPPKHPAYSRFVSYRTTVTVHRDEELLFRGRVLYPHDDFQGRRTITCEGERCFLRDGVIRPYRYSTTPALIFADVIGRYNEQVDAFKQFRLGRITVSSNAVSFENSEAEPISDTVDKLVDIAGGYVTFTTAADGVREINWLEDLQIESTQTIEFGENLLDYARTVSNPDLATVIIPYGAMDSETGKRLTVKNVNGGLDYIRDEEAIALRGVVCKTKIWDEVTTPGELYVQARRYLNVNRNIITSLELTALDLAPLKRSVDSFRVGDYVSVYSHPHGIHDSYRIVEQSLDLLNPHRDKVILGKSIVSLTGSDVAGDRSSSRALQRTGRAVGTDVSAQLTATEVRMTLYTDDTVDEVRREAADTYATNQSVDDLIDFVANELDGLKEADEEQKELIRAENGGISIGESGSENHLRVENGRLKGLLDGAWTPITFASQKVLWSGSDLMVSGLISLTEAVNSQDRGIVLVFSPTDHEGDFIHFFVPKHFVSLKSGFASAFRLTVPDFSADGVKRLYINDSAISGDVQNNASGTVGGISYNNAGFVLRYVLGT